MLDRGNSQGRSDSPAIPVAVHAAGPKSRRRGRRDPIACRSRQRGGRRTGTLRRQSLRIAAHTGSCLAFGEQQPGKRAEDLLTGPWAKEFRELKCTRLLDSRVIPVKVLLRGKASDRSQWASASMATLPAPLAAYSNGPGLAEPVRSYVCALQPRPFAQSFHRQG